MYSNLGNASKHPTTSTTAARNPNAYHQHQHHPITIPLPAPPPPPFCTSCGSNGGGEGGDEFQTRDERFPQWSNQETRDFIEIRAQFDGDLATPKRNNNLWEMLSYRLKEKGYSRTPDQCKCKWESLVDGYKGEETSDLDNGRQCPFFDELHAFFTARGNTMQQFQHNYEAGLTKGRKRLKTIMGHQSSDKLSEEEDDDVETDAEIARTEIVAPKRDSGKEKRQRTVKSAQHLRNTNVNNNDSVLGVFNEILQDFSRHQQTIDMQWRESMGKYAQQRAIFDQECRQTMERLERERIMRDQAWWEREEQRRIKEESRAEKRDILLTTLLNKLIHEDDP